MTAITKARTARMAGNEDARHNGQTKLAESEGSQGGEGTTTRRELDSSRVLFITHVVVGVCQGCFFVYNSLLPYLFRTYGVDTVTFGYIQSGCSILQLLLSPVIGRFGDKYGARAVLILSALSTASGHVIMGVARNLPMMLLSKVSTVAQDIRLGAQLMVSDLVEGKERGVAMGKLVLPMSLGMFIGPALGGQLANFLGQQNSLLFTWLFPVGCVLLLIASVPRETRTKAGPHVDINSKKDKGAEKKKGLISCLKDDNIRFLMIAKVLIAIPFMTLAQNLGVIGMTVFKLTPQMNGLLLSYNGVVNIVLSGFVLGRLTKKFSEDQLLKFAPLLMVLAYALVSQASGAWMILIVLIPWNLGNSILDNQVISRLTKSVPQSETGTMVGINASLFQLSRIIAPVLGGVLIQKLGFQAIGYFGVVVSLGLATLTFVGL